MHKRQLCQKILEKALSGELHKKRIDCLVKFSSSLMDYDIQLSVSEIGKHLESQTSVKHNLKSADYFVGNEKLSKELLKIYRGLSHYFFKGYQELIVLVDWSGACSEGYYTLTASIAGHGRSIPVYQEIHEKKEQETEEVHNKFLDNLKEVLPLKSKVTVITDAGFHRNWFRKVSLLGWDYIGRVYSRYYYKEENGDEWKSLVDINFVGYEKAKALGKVRLGKTKKGLEGYLYTYREKISGKEHKKNRYPSHEKSYSDYYRNGWVIISSLEMPPKKLVNYYRKRMQIEQNFKDIKSERYGVGLRRNGSRGLVRIRMLFFLGTLITLLLWWIGLMTERTGHHRQYQANTRQDKRIISFIHLARMVLRQKKGNIDWLEFKKTMTSLRKGYMDFIHTGVLI